MFQDRIMPGQRGPFGGGVFGALRRMGLPIGQSQPGLGQMQPMAQLGAPQIGQLAPMRGATAPAINRPPPGLFSRGGMQATDWLSLGAGLMGAGQASWNTNQPSGFTLAGQLIGDLGQQVRDRGLQDEELSAWRQDRQRQQRREDVTWRREDQAFARDDDRRAKQAAWLQSLPQEERLFAEAAPEAAFQAYGERMYARPEMTSDGLLVDPYTGKTMGRVEDVVTEDEQLQRRLLQAQINAANAQAQSAGMGGISKAFQQRDAVAIAEANEQAVALQNKGLPTLYRLRDLVKQAAAKNAVGQPIDYNSRITLGRVLGGPQEDRAALEQWRAQILGPAIAMFAGTGPLSNKELEAALNSMANPNMTAGASMALLDQQIAEAERKIQTAQAMTQYFQENGGLTGVRDAQGRDFVTLLQEQRAPQAASPAAGAAAPPPPPAIGEQRGGYVYAGGDPANPASWKPAGAQQPAEGRTFWDKLLTQGRF